MTRNNQKVMKMKAWENVTSNMEIPWCLSNTLTQVSGSPIKHLKRRREELVEWKRRRYAFNPLIINDRLCLNVMRAFADYKTNEV